LFQQLIFRPLVIRWTEVPYSQFLQQLDAGEITKVEVTTDRILYTCCEDANSGTQGQSNNVVRVDDPDLIQRLVDAGVTFSAQEPTNTLFSSLLGWFIPMIPLGIIWYFGLRRMGQAGAGVMSIGKSRAKEITGEKTGVKFKDVGGADEVEVELKEIIEFLQDPQRFTRLGAKLPKGVLLVGPPGTGKTLLAKATAGEAGVPFFSISGSDFVEMFVGVGAARVRDLFEQAKQRSPCIVFIDEIDAIGQSRATVGALGTNDEREQTLNQLLSEMDGFEPNQGVIIMAATNRPEILDRALLRPGRFDRQVQVSMPTEEGRRQILAIHTSNVQLADDVDLARVAQITAGFSGADLANIVNEAALLAVRNKREAVTMGDFDLAIERVVAGLQRKITLKPELKRRVAYHEGGHALVAQLQPDTDPVHKVSIIPTAKGALGYTLQMPEEDTYLMSKSELEERLAVILGGRAAELLVLNDTSTGAANDLQVATALARRMVTEFGMTEALGPVRYAPDEATSYLTRLEGTRNDVSPETATLIDKETRRIIEDAERRAVRLLQQHSETLHEIARILQEKEVISGDEIKQLVQKPE
ncbi:MAG: ATP-dependent zinc metalloprotease FtsH, partial [Caldilineaceae bacterium]